MNLLTGVRTNFRLLLLLILVCAPLFISCNNDEDDSDPMVNISEKIVGHWNLNRRDINGTMEDLEICELSTYINFTGDGNLDVTVFIGDEIANCQSASNTGVWDYLGGDEMNILLDTQETPTLI